MTGFFQYLRVLLAVALLAAVSALAAPARAEGNRLDTAVHLFGEEATPAAAPTVFRRVRGSGATFIRLILSWSSVAPSGVTKPKGFAAADPADAAYRWADFDRLIRLAVANRLQPIVNIYGAPRWAEGDGAGVAGTVRPDANELALFAAAAALRYSGRFEDLPRVRYWMVWNEPNLTYHLSPQFVGKTPVSPLLYRAMVNKLAEAVKGVHRDNIVVAGVTAPFRDLQDGIKHTNWGPLGFMRELLCLDRKLKPKCRARVTLDVWSHHPYTSGGPTHDAVLPDDVSLGDLPEMRRVLDAAVRAGKVVSPRRPLFWVTEFSWDSRPPDPGGVPAALHRRWVAEGLYRMWANGVSLVTWLSVRDQPLATSINQSGLWYRGATLAADRPKPSLAAFRFPFVAFPRGNGVYVWGRTPAGRPAGVLVEQQFRGGWKRLGIVKTNAHGIFQGRYVTNRTGFVRARTIDRGERAVPFSLRAVPDRFFNPFGGQPVAPPRP